MTAQAMTAPPRTPSQSLDVFLVAAEESGDRLGAALMRALRERTGGQVRFAGVGGRDMEAEGVVSLYPVDDLPIIGFPPPPDYSKDPATDAAHRQDRRGAAPPRPGHHR